MGDATTDDMLDDDWAHMLGLGLLIERSGQHDMANPIGCDMLIAERGGWLPADATTQRTTAAQDLPERSRGHARDRETPTRVGVESNTCWGLSAPPVALGRSSRYTPRVEVGAVPRAPPSSIGAPPGQAARTPSEMVARPAAVS
jgi:hypothetical protein